MHTITCDRSISMRVQCLSPAQFKWWGLLSDPRSSPLLITDVGDESESAGLSFRKSESDQITVITAALLLAFQIEPFIRFFFRKWGGKIVSNGMDDEINPESVISFTQGNHHKMITKNNKCEIRWYRSRC